MANGKKRNLSLVSVVQAERDGRTVVDQQTEAPMVRGYTGGVDWVCGACRRVLVAHDDAQPAPNYDEVLMRCLCGAINRPPR
ncbi:MAG TPA: hypothetical protein VM840_02460 [Actinomycetota bacterium]|nr:hypothetical protein [Actinomycetota bacterium]